MKKEKTSSPVELCEIQSFINRNIRLIIPRRTGCLHAFSCLFLKIFFYFAGEYYIQLDI